MKSITLLLLSGCISSAFALPVYPPIKTNTSLSSQQSIEMSAKWLASKTMDVELTNGMHYAMPKSYDPTWGADGLSYWQYLEAFNPDYKNYLATHDTGDCVVQAGNEASIERAVTSNGSNIYDGAVWTIAMAVAANTPYISYDDKMHYRDLIHGYQTILFAGGSKHFDTYKAWKAGEGQAGAYHYGPTKKEAMPSAKESYSLQFISPTYSYNHEPIHQCDMNWPIWEAITGEQAWSALIGPVQTAYILNNGAPGWEYASSIQLAINSLPSILAMQDPESGGVYRNVMLPGQDPTAKNFNISLENDFSLYAGLAELKEALEARIANNNKSSDSEALDTVNNLLQGLDKFFSDGSGKVTVFDKDQGYFYSSVERQSDGTYTHSDDYAVDVQTWGISTFLGYPDLLKAVTDKFGADTLQRMWQSVLDKGAYRVNDKLTGVGYTAQTPSDPYYEMSGEWSLGAISAAIALAAHTTDASLKAKYEQDARDMLEGMKTQIATVTGSNDSELGYLYANKRIMIPFGWNSNAMPATSATGWGLMVNSCYDPFVLGGATKEREGVCKALGLQANIV